MIDIIQNTISLYGKTVTILDANKNTISSTKAFIQPLRSDYQSPLYEDYQQDKSVEQFLYIGLPEVNLNQLPSGTLIQSGSKIYAIKMSETVYLSEDVVYERAVLENYTSE